MLKLAREFLCCCAARARWQVAGDTQDRHIVEVDQKQRSDKSMRLLLSGCFRGKEGEGCVLPRQEATGTAMLPRVRVEAKDRLGSSIGVCVFGPPASMQGTATLSKQSPRMVCMIGSHKQMGARLSQGATRGQAACSSAQKKERKKRAGDAVTSRRALLAVSTARLHARAQRFGSPSSGGLGRLQRRRIATRLTGQTRGGCQG